MLLKLVYYNWKTGRVHKVGNTSYSDVLQCMSSENIWLPILIYNIGYTQENNIVISHMNSMQHDKKFSIRVI